DGRLDLGALVVYAQSAVGASMIAFGGLNWALDGAAAPVAAVLRLEASMAPAGALSIGAGDKASGGIGAAGRDGQDGSVRSAQGRLFAALGMTSAAPEIRFRDVAFAYPGGAPVLEGFDLTIPAGSSLAIVGQNGAGK